jgi:hypothetical protein
MSTRHAIASLATTTIIGSAACLVAHVDALGLHQWPAFAGLHWVASQSLASILEASAVAIWIVNTMVDT